MRWQLQPVDIGPVQLKYILSTLIVYMLYPKLDRRLFSITTETTLRFMGGFSEKFVFSDSITIYK
jgi:hypothetical protein